MFDLLESFTQICGGEVKAQPEGSPDTPSAEAVLLTDWTLHGKSFVDNPTVDPTDDNNYLTAHLTRPMGILFEENYDVQHGGAYIAEINEGSSAAADGSIYRGDQLIAIGEKRVIGIDFDDIMQIIEESDTNIKLTVFRGPAESLYGPSYGSGERLGEYVPERGEEAALVEVEDSESEVVREDIGVIAARQDYMDAVALAVAAVGGDAIGATVKADLFGVVTTAVLDAFSLGILFKENYDVQHGGAYIAEINEGGSAAADGSICRGDQLIAIGEKRVIGMDFDDIMQIIEESDTNIKLTVFRGPAESLYGPSYGSGEQLGDHVPGRGEEAALVEEEDSESEVVREDIGDIAALQDNMDAVALAVAAVDGDAIGGTYHVTLVGEEFHVVKETTAEVEEELVVLENEDEADEMNEVYVDVEKEAVCEDGLEKVADTAEEVLIIDEEVDSEEDVGHEGSVEKKADASDEAEDVLNENEADAGEAVLVMDEVEKEEEVACDADLDLESDPSMLNEAANDSNMDWLDSHYENTASQTISTALAAVVREEISNDGKSNLEENSLPLRELPLKKLEAGSTLVDITKSFDEKKEVVGTDGAAAGVVEDDVNVDEEVVGEGAPEIDASMINGPVTNASNSILVEHTVCEELKGLEAAGPGPVDISKSFDEKEEVGGNGAAVVVVEDDANVDEDIAGEAEPETAASMLNGPVTNASMTKDLLDNDASLISDDELDDVKLKASVEDYFLQLDGLMNH